jgi:hypothetical protein
VLFGCIGFHEVKHTPFGNKADLNISAQLLANDGINTQENHSIFLCFRPNLFPVVSSYLPFIATLAATSPTPLTLYSFTLYARTLALLTAMLYGYDQKMVLQALEAFMVQLHT